MSAKTALLSAVVLRAGLWDAQAAAWSRLIPHDWPGEHVQAWAEMVMRGDAHVIDAVRNGERIGVVVYSVCRDYENPEFVILGAYSPETHADLTTEVLPELSSFARAAGCATVRFHTMRPGLLHKAIRAGFTVSEIVLRRDLSHGV